MVGAASQPPYISLLVIVVVDDPVGWRCRMAKLRSFSHTMLVLLLVNLDVVDVLVVWEMPV